MSFHSTKKEQLLRKLESNMKEGISEREAKSRLERNGENSLDLGKKINPLKLFLDEFKSPLVLILIVAALISGLFGSEHIDTILIIVIVFLNALFGFYQNYNAERSMESLKEIMVSKAKVLRDGILKEIDARHLVEGDIVVLEEGDKVPADLRILECKNLLVDESILTGESISKEKKDGVIAEETPLAERGNMLYMNTYINRGRAKAIVVGTGLKTEFGKIAKTLSETKKEKTVFQKELDDLGKKIGLLIMAVVVLVFIINYFLSPLSFFETFLLSISLAVAAIPEGLPAVVTLTLAIGTRKMVRKNALVRSLPVVESLGSVNVICTDKTGTLTENKMTVKKIYCEEKEFKVEGAGYDLEGEIIRQGRPVIMKHFPLLEKSLEVAFFCNNSSISATKDDLSITGDPTEIALKIAAMKSGIKIFEEEEYLERIDEIPFSSERKMMSVIVKTSRGLFLMTKGAPEKIIEKSKLSRNELRKIRDKLEEYSSEGLRVLALAHKSLKEEDLSKKNLEVLEKDLEFLSLMAMVDPPRKEVKDAIVTTKNAGIRVIMITGDNLLTAEYIAKETGIEGKAIESSELDKADDNLIEEIVKKYNVFARATPEHKFRILRALQEQGNIVAMTGDGVNDAPALKKADVGIAMGIRGTEVSKEASDIVLLDDNFATITEAIKEGRTIFINIRKFVNALLSANMAEVLGVFIASLFGTVLLLPAQILWMNLLTDGLPALALGSDPSPGGIMRRRPKPPKEGVLTKNIIMDIVITGVLLSLIILSIFKLNLSKGYIYAQTLAFTAFVFYEFIRIFVIRKEYNTGFFENKWLLLAIIASILLQLLLLYTPLSKIFQTTSLNTEAFGILAVGGLLFYGLSSLSFKLLNKK